MAERDDEKRPPLDADPSLAAAEVEAGEPLDSGEQAGKRAAKNTLVRAVGEIVGKVGSLVLFAFMARELGDAGLGTFLFALAWGEVALTPVGLGIDQYLLRALAADRSRVDELFANAIYLKLARGIPVVIATCVLVYVLDYSDEKTWAVVVLTVGLFFDTLARSPMNLFNAFERGELVAITIVAQRFFAAAAGLLALALGGGVVEVAITYSLACVLRLALSMRLQTTRLRPRRWIFPAEPRRELRKKSLPFTAGDLFGLVLARADVLILAALASEAVVGLYGSAYRLFDATTFITIALVGAFSAMYTYLGRDTTPTLASVFQRSLKLALALLLPFSVAFGLLAEPLCTAFFGDGFADAADPLRVLAAVPTLWGVLVLANVLVLSRERPRRMVWCVGLAAVVNVVLNVTLIPPYEDVGAAIAMLGSVVVYCFVALWLALLEVGRVHWMSMTAAPITAAVAMAAVLIALSGLPLVALVAGGFVYATVYAAVERRVDPDDLSFVVNLIRSRLPGGGGRAQEGAA